MPAPDPTNYPFGVNDKKRRRLGWAAIAFIAAQIAAFAALSVFRR